MMNIPASYPEWKLCITRDCGIALTPVFLTERVAHLKDEKNPNTRQFIELYGKDHHLNVLGWFEYALNEHKN